MEDKSNEVREWVPDGIVELRVHGIGDHKEWSSLGSPTIYFDGGKSFPTLLAPPMPPGHEVALFNWSRVTRGVVRVLWYLAFPFTLINVAYQMGPVEDGWRRRVHLILVHIASLGLTAIASLWLLSLLERLPWIFQHDRFFGVDAALVSMWVGVVGTLIFLGVRARGAATAHRLSSILHGALILAIMLSVQLARPAQIRLAYDSIFVSNASYGPSAEGNRLIMEYFQSRPGVGDWLQVETFPFLDVISLATWVGLTVGMGVVVFLLLISAIQRDGMSAPLVGSAASVAFSYLVAIPTFSALVGRLPALIGELSSRVPVLEGRLSEIPEPYLTASHGMSRSGFVIPGFALAVLIFAVVVGILSSGFRPLRFVVRPAVRKIRARWRPSLSANLGDISRERAVWSHAAVCDKLPRIMTATVISLMLFTEVIALLLVNALSDGAEGDYGARMREYVGGSVIGPVPSLAWIEWVLVGLSSAAVIVAFWMLGRGASGPLRQVLAKIGDVSGFWPITASPFGGRSYRDTVVRELDAMISGGPGAERVVLVGHSQGSVLAAWYSHRLTCQGRRLHGLVTCGSPLVSLYERFFPATFSGEFLDKVVGDRSPWVNVWRETDPISTEIPHAGENHNSLDPPVGGYTVRGHHDYWIDDFQEEVLAGLCGGTESTGTPSPGEPGSV